MRPVRPTGLTPSWNTTTPWPRPSRGVRGGAELRKKIARAQRLAAQLAAVQNDIYEATKDVW